MLIFLMILKWAGVVLIGLGLILLFRKKKEQKIIGTCIAVRRILYCNKPFSYDVDFTNRTNYISWQTLCQYTINGISYIGREENRMSMKPKKLGEKLTLYVSPDKPTICSTLSPNVGPCIVAGVGGMFFVLSELISLIVVMSLP